MNILQFSGGIDSLACLILLQDIPNLQVVSISTDGAYSERKDYLRKVQKTFSHLAFHQMHTARYLNLFGLPVDVVPIRWTKLGVLLNNTGNAPRYQDSYSCCARAIWEPLDELCRELKATTIFRGVRNNDMQKALVKDGDVVNGVKYHFPIHDWTRERVFSFVKEHASELIAESYLKGEETSRDCIDCTAYLWENKVRIKNLPVAQWKDLTHKLNQWRDDVATELEMGL